MSDADKATAPAQDPQIAQLRAELAEERRNHQNLRQAFNQRDEEIKAARRAVQQQPTYEPEYEDPEPPQRGNGHSRYSDEDIEELRFKQAKVDFLASNPGAHEEWAKINAIILDQTRASEYAAWDARGRVNYERVIRDIHRDLRWQAVEEARKAAAASPTPVTPVAQPTGTLTQGSSTTTPGPNPVPDFDRMSPQERQQTMLDRGMVEVDPSDPPRIYTPQRRA